MPPVRGDDEEQAAAGHHSSCDDHPEPARREDNAVPSMRPVHFGERSRHHPYSCDHEEYEGHLGDFHAAAMSEGDKPHVEAMLVACHAGGRQPRVRGSAYV